MNDNSEERPQEGRKPVSAKPRNRSLTGWALVLPVALIGGLFWFNDRPPAPTTDTSITETATPSATPDGGGGSAALPAVVQIYLPDENGTLTTQKATLQRTDGVWANQASRGKQVIESLLTKSPADFPSGTKVLDTTYGGDGTLDLNFNEAFRSPNFWQGSARTLSTVYAIVNSVVKQQYAGDSVSKVRILIEGKPVDVLGELDLSEPLGPDMSLVAKG
jgi:hypothetical protein